ncbi:MAG: Sua5/YciO/YrdC/YwlC family protein, partial [Bacteroidota bacterium]|nr:Sua5/YciO/YrdC/YwlC family protein [Bacteroidota bacterium]
SKSLIILVSDVDMLKEYVAKIPEKIFVLLAQEQNPITIIYPNARKLAKNAIADDGTIAIRIPKDDFCLSLIQKFKKPIISTSANISGELAPKNFLSISEQLKKKVDYIVDYKQNDDSSSKASKIVKIENNELVYIRK